MVQRKFLWACLFVLLSIFISSQIFAQDDVLKKRKDFMRANNNSLKAIRKAVKGKDYAAIEVMAKEIVDRMDKVLEHFPKGSIPKKSRAKPEIWEQWDKFSKIPAKVKKVAWDLAKAAAAKDEAQVQVYFKALGPKSAFRSGACYQCHKDFRTARKRKKKS